MKKIILFGVMALACGSMAAADSALFTIFPATDAPIENIYRVALSSADANKMYMYDKFASEKAYMTFKAEGATEAETVKLYPSDDRSSIEFISEKVIYTPGECEIVVPAGSITGFDLANGYQEFEVKENLTYKFTVKGGTTNPENLSFTVSPESGSKVSSLEITFTSTDEKVGMTPNGNPNYSNIYFAKDGNMVCLADAEPSDDGLTMVVKPEKEITEPGQYVLIVAYGGLYYYDPSDTFPMATPCTEPMFFSYTIKSDDEPSVFSVTPEPASTVENIYKVSLTPAEGVTNMMNDMYGTTKAYFNVDGEFFCNASCQLSMEDFTSLEIAPDLFIYTPGDCELVIEAGYLTWKDADGATQKNTKDLTFKYNVKGGFTNPTDLPFEVTPADGAKVETLESILIKIDEEYTLMYDPRLADLFYFAQDGKKVCGANCTLLPDDITLKVVPEEELTADAQYDFVIMPMGISYLNADYDYGYNDTPLVFRYNHNSDTGINTVATDKTINGIYNLYGVKMNGSFESLAPGIYVVNGKKIVKK